MRLRLPKPAHGAAWGIREAARQLTVEASVVRYQLAHGKIARLGDGVDAVSAWEWAKSYEPHHDNAQRRVRGHTLAAAQASAAPRQAAGAALGVASGGAGVPNHGQAVSGGRALVAAGTRAKSLSSAAQLPVLDTRELVESYLAFQTKLNKGKLNPSTASKYKIVFTKFATRFPVLPMEPVKGREEIVAWIHGLRNELNGDPLSDGSKATTRKTVASLYNWLQRETGATVPSLVRTSLPGMSAGGGVVYMDEVRLVLAQARDHTDYTLVLVFAQTGARLGEVCSIRPECMQPYWVHTWDKSTRINPTGYRPLFLPDESYAAVQQELRAYGQLMLNGKPLAGPVTPVELNGRMQRVRLDDPTTFRVDPMPGARDGVQYAIKRMMVAAGVYEPGKLVHAYRRAWQAEWAKNGGNAAYGDYIMGHFNKSNMTSLYFHDKNDEIAEQVRKYAPRRFLLPEKTEAAA